jgi:hypothetical protein
MAFLASFRVAFSSTPATTTRRRGPRRKNPLSDQVPLYSNWRTAIASTTKIAKVHPAKMPKYEAVFSWLIG